MQVTFSHHARAVLAAAVTATALSLAPVVTATATAASSRAATDSAQCTAAKTALSQARAQQHTAKVRLIKARKALRKARAAHRPAKVRKAKIALRKATARYNATTKVVNARGTRMSYACAAPTSAVRARGTGKTLGLLALANGISLGPVSVDQLTALLDRFLPGVASQLSAEQLTALLGGFNSIASGGANPADVLALLGGSFTPEQITSILSSLASPEVISKLAGEILSELGGLGGGLPLPTDFDPTGVVSTLEGMFGNLNPSQFGDLLVLLTRATGTSGSTFSLDQLTGLISAFAPGATSAFSASDLTTMLGVLNSHAASEAVLANLLGGQFTTQQLSSVMGGSAPTALVGAVFAQVMAEFATGGNGGLSLPTSLDPTQLTSLVSTVTSLITGLLGGGGGLVGGICGLLPLPGLCP